MPTVEDILMIKGPDVIVADSTATVLEGVKLMDQADVGSVVIRKADESLGIFTERDLLRRVVARHKDPSSVVLAEVMSSPVKSCSLADDVRECGRMLDDSHIRHLVVIEEGELVGLIGLREILAAELHTSEKRVKVLQSLTQ